MNQKEQTRKEMELEQTIDGHREMELRNRIGPRRIEASVPQSGKWMDKTSI